MKIHIWESYMRREREFFFEENDIYRNGNEGMISKAQIHSNRIVQNGKYGVYLTSTGTGEIKQNEIFENQNYGLYLGTSKFDATVITIENNRIENNKQNLIRLLFDKQSWDSDTKTTLNYRLEKDWKCISPVIQNVVEISQNILHRTHTTHFYVQVTSQLALLDGRQ